MSSTMRQIVFGLEDEKTEQEKVFISLEDIEEDKLFLLHFIIGTYFGPDLKNHHLLHTKKQSAYQIQTSSFNLLTKDELSGSIMKRAELERVYRYTLRNADPSLIFKRERLSSYFNGKCNASNGDLPLFRDLFPWKLHPETRFGNRHKFIESVVFINDPDTSCMREDCVERFKRLTGLQSFSLSLNIDVTEPVDANEVEMEPLKEEDTINDDAGSCTSGEESDFEARPTLGVNGEVAEAQAGKVMGLMDIGECSDAYLFRVSLPGVKRDERDFSCQVEDNGKVLVRGVTTTGERRVQRYSQVFKMKTRNLCPPGHFSVSFHLPGPVHPEEFTGSFGTDGIFEGIVMKDLQKQTL